VGLTNAFNFLDNMDGWAAGVGLAVALLFAAAQLQVGSLFAPAVRLVLARVLGGFLVHNRYPSRLFLGDSGSDFLGFLLGAMTVAGTYYRYGAGDSRSNVLLPLLVMAVPLYESASVFVIWLGEQHDPFTWNRHHFSYRLLESGLTPPPGGARDRAGVGGLGARGAAAPPARRAGDGGGGPVGLPHRRGGAAEKSQRSGAGGPTRGSPAPRRGRARTRRVPCPPSPPGAWSDEGAAPLSLR